MRRAPARFLALTLLGLAWASGVAGQTMPSRVLDHLACTADPATRLCLLEAAAVAPGTTGCRTLSDAMRRDFHHLDHLDPAILLEDGDALLLALVAVLADRQPRDLVTLMAASQRLAQLIEDRLPLTQPNDLPAESPLLPVWLLLAERAEGLRGHLSAHASMGTPATPWAPRGALLPRIPTAAPPNRPPPGLTTSPGNNATLLAIRRAAALGTGDVVALALDLARVQAEQRWPAHEVVAALMEGFPAPPTTQEAALWRVLALASRLSSLQAGAAAQEAAASATMSALWQVLLRGADRPWPHRDRAMAHVLREGGDGASGIWDPRALAVALRLGWLDGPEASGALAQLDGWAGQAWRDAAAARRAFLAGDANAAAAARSRVERAWHEALAADRARIAAAAAMAVKPNPPSAEDDDEALLRRLFENPAPPPPDRSAQEDAQVLLLRAVLAALSGAEQESRTLFAETFAITLAQPTPWIEEAVVAAALADSLDSVTGMTWPDALLPQLRNLLWRAGLLGEALRRGLPQDPAWHPEPGLSLADDLLLAPLTVRDVTAALEAQIPALRTAEAQRHLRGFLLTGQAEAGERLMEALSDTGLRAELWARWAIDLHAVGESEGARRAMARARGEAGGGLTQSLALAEALVTPTEFGRPPALACEALVLLAVSRPPD